MASEYHAGLFIGSADATAKPHRYTAILSAVPLTADPGCSLLELPLLDEPHAPLLLRVESKAGHGAGKPTSKILDEYSQVWAFIAAQTKAVWRD